MNNASISIVMNGIHKCSGACLYCSAAKSMDYRGKDNENSFKFYPDKLKERILEYTKNALEQGKKQDGTMLSVDIWGGNPVENFEPFKKVVEFCENELKEFRQVKLHTSGNGLELQDRDVVDYLLEHHIGYQLSHDGLGQWIRTGIIDPLYWDKTKDNIAELVKKGNLDWINAALSQRNPSYFANIEYFNKWRKDFDIMEANITIKLNHIYDGTAPIDKKWMFDDNPQIKKGEVIGDLCFTGKTLQEHFHEFRKLAIMLYTPGMRDNPEFAPYYNYITGQAERYRMLKEGEVSGACVGFQTGVNKTNFAIDTKGEYCQCNLIDSDHHVLHPSCEQPDYCKGCRYKNLAECHPCGSEPFKDKCEWHYYWAETLEEMFQFLEYKRITESLMQNNSCKCGEHKQQRQDNHPVFCVKNYGF
ncbi:MAG: hypothetical protein J6S67_22870 [Methanobrevibacter sp.]|nr:hypothetical protein [Methanobrevibacter sp.]